MSSPVDLTSLHSAEPAILIVDGCGDIVFSNAAFSDAASAKTALSKTALPKAAAEPPTHPASTEASGPSATATARLNLREVVLPVECERILESRAPTTVRITPHGDHSRLGVAECTVVPLTLSSTPRRFLLIFQRSASEVLPMFAREEFLATVAHDLKNPLGAAFSYADALLDTSIGDGLNEKQRQTITRIRATVLRSIDLVRNYQQLAQLRGGSLPRPESPTDLNAIVATVLEYCWRPDGSSPKLSLTLTSEDILVPVERLPLERVVSNIFSNAVKFTPPDGHITVKTARSSDGECSVTITNTGSGIHPDERQVIFQRFTRGSAAAGTTGSGLGLYIVKTILDTIGGQISVTSEPHVKDNPAQTHHMVTTFAVTLPRAR